MDAPERACAAAEKALTRAAGLVSDYAGLLAANKVAQRCLDKLEGHLETLRPQLRPLSREWLTDSGGQVRGWVAAASSGGVGGAPPTDQTPGAGGPCSRGRRPPARPGPPPRAHHHP